MISCSAPYKGKKCHPVSEKLPYRYYVGNRYGNGLRNNLDKKPVDPLMRNTC